MHEDSSFSSDGNEEMVPVKAQPYLFGPVDDMEEMNFPTDGHLQKQINL
jgi:hypothetical protein